MNNPPDNPPFRSDISFSVQNEDYQTELAILKRRPRKKKMRVLLIASSGENALSLLTQANVAEIEAVDINPAQLHLCALRRTALEHFTQAEQLRLLGADAERIREAGEPDRLALYDRLRPHLSEMTRAFWDARREREIAFGVQHVGRNDVGMHNLSTALHTAGFAPLERPVLEADLPAWKNTYTQLMTPDYIRNLFGLQSDGLAAKISGIAGYLGECHFRALQQPRANRNPFVTTVFTGYYATASGEAGLPLYLQAKAQATLKKRGMHERLRLHVGNVLEQMKLLARERGAFDLISLSNIADWMTETQFAEVVTQAHDCLTTGGALLARTATGNPMIVEVMSRLLLTDSDLHAELPRLERGPWFRTIAVGFRPS